MMRPWASAVPADDERRVRELLYGTQRQARDSLEPGAVDGVAVEEPEIGGAEAELPADPEPGRRPGSRRGRLRRAREKRRRRMARELVLQQEWTSGPPARPVRAAPADGAEDPQLALAAAEERAAAAKRELDELRRKSSAEVEELARIGARSLARAEVAERRLAATRDLVRDLSDSTALAESAASGSPTNGSSPSAERGHGLHGRPQGASRRWGRRPKAKLNRPTEAPGRKSEEGSERLPPDATGADLEPGKAARRRTALRPPVLAALFLIVMLATLALPGSANGADDAVAGSVNFRTDSAGYGARTTGASTSRSADKHLRVGAPS